MTPTSRRKLRNVGMTEDPLAIHRTNPNPRARHRSSSDPVRSTVAFHLRDVSRLVNRDLVAGIAVLLSIVGDEPLSFVFSVRVGVKVSGRFVCHWCALTLLGANTGHEREQRRPAVSVSLALCEPQDLRCTQVRASFREAPDESGVTLRL